MVRVKICGLREPAHALAAAEAGADFLGLVFAPGRRQLTLTEAERLVQAARTLPASPRLVGVFAGTPAPEVNQIAAHLGLDLVQLSGDESWAFCQKMTRPVVRTVHISPTTTAAEALAAMQQGLAARPDLRFLLDTRVGTASGGTGQTFDWHIAEEVAARYPVIVAGGLTPENVGELISTVHPWGVDVSSGVETAGVKDMAKICDFIRAAKAAGEKDAAR